jgi:hypothetical protein
MNLLGIYQYYMLYIHRSQDSSVGISTAYWPDGLGSIPGRARDFLTASRPALVLTQSPIQWVLGTLSLWVKRRRREADLSPSSSAGVKNVGAIPPLSHRSSWCGALLITLYIHTSTLEEGARGSVVGWGTVLEAGRWRDRGPRRWIFFQFT